MTVRTTTTTATLTEYAVLGVLGRHEEPVSGYDLRKLIERSVGYIWQPSKTQLYVVLRRLVAAGLATSREVEQRDRPDKQLYAITDTGRAAVRQWLDADEEPGTDPDRSVLVLKLHFGAQGDRAALARQVAAFRDAFAARLTEYEPMLDPAADEFRMLTLRYGIARARAAVEWADAALEELA